MSPRVAEPSAAGAMVSLGAARTSLARAWLVGAGLLSAVLVVRSILRGRAEDAQEVWSWFLPQVLPTVGLMIGVLGAAALRATADPLVRKSFFGLAYWLSIAYLVTLSLTILLEPLSPLRGAQLHSMSNYWMGPFQGLVVASLSYLFTSAEKGTRPSPAKTT